MIKIKRIGDLPSVDKLQDDDLLILQPYAIYYENNDPVKDYNSWPTSKVTLKQLSDTLMSSKVREIIKGGFLREDSKSGCYVEYYTYNSGVDEKDIYTIFTAIETVENNEEFCRMRPRELLYVKSTNVLYYCKKSYGIDYKYGMKDTEKKELTTSLLNQLPSYSTEFDSYTERMNNVEVLLANIEVPNYASIYIVYGFYRDRYVGEDGEEHKGRVHTGNEFLVITKPTLQTFAISSETKLEIYDAIKNYQPPFSDKNFWTPINLDITSEESVLYINDKNILTLKLQEWETNCTYKKGNLIIYNNQMYLCLDNHTSDDWFTDLKAGYWTAAGGGAFGASLDFVPYHLYNKDELAVYENNIYQRITTGRDTEWIPENWYLLTNANVSSLFVKYAPIMPQSDSDMQDEPSDYIGISYGNFATAPAHFENYQWYKIKGADGTINLEANSLVLTYELAADDWGVIDNYYYQTINKTNFEIGSNPRKIMELVTRFTRPIVDVELSDDHTLWHNELEAFSRITSVVTENDSENGGGKITFYCLKKPTNDFTVKLRINGDIHEDRFVTTTAFSTYQTTMNNQMQSLQNQINDLQTLVGSLNTALEDILEGGD